MPRHVRDNNLLVSILASILAITSLLYGIALSAESKSASPAKRPIVQQIANIRVGSTLYPEVIDRYGKGLFVENEGHGGGRYYTNKSRSYTLHVVIGVDKVIEDVEISVGLHIPRSASIKTAISQKLTDTISVDHGIKLGMKRMELIAILGEPNEQKMKGDTLILEYHTSEKEDERVSLYYDAYYEFKDDKLIRIMIHDGC